MSASSAETAHAVASATVQAPIYLDYAATTPVDAAVLEAMLPYLAPGSDALWANPASAHAAGRRAAAVVARARAQVAELINSTAGEIIFTSGATEANNLAIKGALEFNSTDDRPLHIITSRTEHRCVIDTCRWLETRGVSVTWLVPAQDGRVVAPQVLDALRPETLLVSLMWVNNETGAVNDIATLAPALRARGVMLHVDAVQAAGKLPIDVQQVPVDLLSLSAHKIYGPKGIGALFVRRRPRARLAPQLHGGGHEQGMRSGTLATHQIVGMGQACGLADARQAEDAQHLAHLREHLWRGLYSGLPGLLRNTPDTGQACAPHVLNVSFDGVEGEALRASLPGLAVSSGSACSSATAEPSYVLRALGRNDGLADASLRFSLGRGTLKPEIDEAIAVIVAAVQRLRTLSPLWDASEAAAPVDAGPVPADPFSYPAPVWQRFWQPGHVGCVPGAVVATARTPASRSVLELSARRIDGRMVDVCFRAFGDPATIAVGAWLAAYCQGRVLAELAAVDTEKIRNALEIDEDRLHCCLLGEDVLVDLLSKLSAHDQSGDVK